MIFSNCKKKNPFNFRQFFADFCYYCFSNKRSTAAAIYPRPLQPEWSLVTSEPANLAGGPRVRRARRISAWRISGNRFSGRCRKRISDEPGHRISVQSWRRIPFRSWQRFSGRLGSRIPGRAFSAKCRASVGEPCSGNGVSGFPAAGFRDPNGASRRSEAAGCEAGAASAGRRRVDRLEVGLDRFLSI